jgi:putative hydrolase of the HAD superfamily
MPNIQSHRLLTCEELGLVEDSIGKQYLQLWGPKLRDIQNILHSKDWFAFDLDDTLHDFRKASSTALLAVLSRINADHGTDIDEMQKLYRHILAEKTAAAFTDGRTSREYRKERFEALTQKIQLPCDDDYFNILADNYEAALSMALCLKCGALGLLTLLKNLGKKIAIITEGPEDAQVWTLRHLGIHNMVDFLATTNRFRTSKVEGLLRRVLEALGVSAKDLVYIGDSWTRDMEPAIEEKVYAIHYSEVDNISLDQVPVRVNTLKKVQFMLEAVPVVACRP